MLYAEGDLRGAEPLLREALVGQRRALGTAHPGTLDTVYNLACVCEALGLLSDALELFQEELAGLVKARGKAHPSRKFPGKTMRAS